MNRKAVGRTSLLVVTATMALTPLGVSAGWLEDFYGQAGAAVNVTAPQAVNTQNAVGFSGGGVAWRYPNTTLNPIQITPPSIKMGCGGIDAYLGGYSFVNKDAFVQALRNFGQAAVGYFFQLALRSMAPEVAVTLDAINDVAQKINQFGANSCQAGALAAKSLADTMGMKDREASTAYVQSVGGAVDWFDAKTSLGAAGGNEVYKQRYLERYGKAEADITVEDVCKSTPVKANAVYWALCNSKINITADEIRLIMSLLGAEFIVTQLPDAEGQAATQENPVGPTIDIAQLIGQAGETSVNLELLKCENAECTNLSKETVAQRPFRAIVTSALVSVTVAATSRATISLSPEAEAVFKLSSVPLWRVASLASTGGQSGALAATMMIDLAEYAATDAAVNFVKHYMDVMEKALVASGAKLPGPLQEKKPQLHARVKAVRDGAIQLAGQLYVNRGDPWQKIEQLDKIERTMMATLNHHLAASQAFMHRR